MAELGSCMVTALGAHEQKKRKSRRVDTRRPAMQGCWEGLGGRMRMETRDVEVGRPPKERLRHACGVKERGEG